MVKNQKQSSGAVIKNFAKFTGKHPRPATLLKRGPRTVVFL